MPPKKKKDEEETAMQVSQGKNALGHRLSDVLSDEQKELIKRCFAKNASDDELAIYFNFCEKAGVDPLRGQAHFIKYNPNDKPIMMIGIDGFQARATEDPRYNGMVANVVYENDNFSMNPVEGTIAHDFGVKNRGKLVGAYAILKRKGMVTAVQWIDFDEYKRKTKIWDEKPEIMITKVARATLLRREYPDNFSGIYTDAEFSAEITDKGDFIDHSKPDTEPFPTGQPTRKVVKKEEPEPEIQDAEFKDVEEEEHEAEEEDDEESESESFLPDDIVTKDMEPRDALKQIMDYAFKKQKGSKVRPIIEKHYAPWETGDPDLWNIPENNVIAIVKELTGIKLKKAEKTKKCIDCDSEITEPEAEEQEKRCLDCYNLHKEDDD